MTCKFSWILHPASRFRSPTIFRIYYITWDRLDVSWSEKNYIRMLWAYMVTNHTLYYCNLVVLLNAAFFVELLDVRLIHRVRKRLYPFFIFFFWKRYNLFRTRCTTVKEKRTHRSCAPTYFPLSVKDVLNKQCLGCCSSTFPFSLHRPPFVPDLITPVKSLFHCVIKVQPAGQYYLNSDELRRVLECVFKVSA
jgi:hypothetical protein